MELDDTDLVITIPQFFHHILGRLPTTLPVVRKQVSIIVTCNADIADHHGNFGLMCRFYSCRQRIRLHRCDDQTGNALIDQIQAVGHLLGLIHFGIQHLYVHSSSFCASFHTFGIILPIGIRQVLGGIPQFYRAFLFELNFDVSNVSTGRRAITATGTAPGKHHTNTSHCCHQDRGHCIFPHIHHSFVI